MGFPVAEKAPGLSRGDAYSWFSSFGGSKSV